MVLYDLLKNIFKDISIIYIYKFYDSDYYEDTFVEFAYAGPVSEIPFELLEFQSSVYYLNKNANILVVGVEA